MLGIGGWELGIGNLGPLKMGLKLGLKTVQFDIIMVSFVI